MEDIPQYNLIQAIDPTKVKVPISDRKFFFGVLTIGIDAANLKLCFFFTLHVFVYYLRLC